MKVRIVMATNPYELESEINRFLDSLAEEPRAIRYFFEDCSAVIEYNEIPKGAICCECKFWDDGGNVESMIGLCQRCGGKKRFGDKACKKYEDRRGY